jgi:hypothetical protein
VLTFKLSQGPASDFTSDNHHSLQGIGVNYPLILFDAESKSKCRIEILIPTNADFENNTVDIDHMNQIIRSCLMINVDSSIIHETGDSFAETTQKNHLEELKSIFFHFNINLQTSTFQSFTLSSIGCGTGIANEGSKPDGVLKDDLIRGNIELKDTNRNPLDGLRQAYAYGISIAFQLYNNGYTHENIMIPLVSSNGQLFQFGVVKVLPPFFPYLIVISKVLDSTDFGDRKLIAGYFLKIAKFIESARMNPPCASVVAQPRGLETSLYFLKNLKNFFFIFGTVQAEASLRHYFLIMQQIYHGSPELRDSIVFPICVRMENESGNTKQYNIQLCDLVFENLSQSGWKIGVPIDKNLREKYFQNLKWSIDLLHHCGVVHMDLYPSNIFWKATDNGEVLVKLIDFDASVFITEPLSRELTYRLAAHEQYRDKLVHNYLSKHHISSPLCCNKYYDLSLLEVLHFDLDDTRLQVTEKMTLDKAFRDCCNEYLQNPSTLPEQLSTLNIHDESSTQDDKV